jgi:hypothetical protein
MGSIPSKTEQKQTRKRTTKPHQLGVVVLACNPSYGRGIVVECLPTKCEVPSSNPNSTQIKPNQTQKPTANKYYSNLPLPF